VHADQRREATLGRERGLGLVEQVGAAGAEAVDEQVQERLAVGAFVRGDAAVGVDRVEPQVLDLGGDVVVGLRPQEEPTPLPPRPAARPIRSAPPSEDSLGRVAKLNEREPPSGLNPAATAMASTSVDFPEPFSPTRNMTPGPNSSRRPRSAVTTGRSNGYPAAVSFSSIST
jgi:hypothetical protein